MMKLIWIVPLILGVLSVCQAGLNERIMTRLGLSATVVLNSVILVAVALCVWVAAHFWPTALLDDFKVPSGGIRWNWWFFVPGVLGFCLVSGLPISFSQNGAGKTMVLLVAAQVAFGVFWDYWWKDQDISLRHIAGVILAIGAAALTASD